MSPLNRRLACVFGVLLVWTLAVERPWAPDSYEAAAQAAEEPFFPDLDAERVAEVVLRRDDQAVRLVRAVDGTWTMPDSWDFPVPAGRVAELVGRMAGLTYAAVISEEESRRDVYNVGAGGTEVTLGDAAGAEMACMVLGKFAAFDPDDPLFEKKFSFDAYVRACGGDRVAVVPNFMPPATKSAEWIDRALFPPTEAQPVSFTVSGTGIPEPFTAERVGEEQWVCVGHEDEPLEAWQAASMARALAFLSANDVAGLRADRLDAEWGFDAPFLQAEVTLEDGTVREVVVGGVAEVDRSYYAARGRWVVEIQKWTVENAAKDWRDLRPEPEEDGAFPDAAVPVEASGE